MDKLVDQTRLPHARLPDDSDELAVAGFGLLQRRTEGLKLGLPSHKVGEPPRHPGLQPLAEGTHPDQFKDLYGLYQSFDGKRPERVGLDKSFNQSERRRRQPD